MRAWSLVCALVTAASFAAAHGGAGPVGCWSFDEPVGLHVLDGSGHARSGEVLNDGRGVTRVAGRRGGALEFAAGDHDQRNQAGCVALLGLEAVDWSGGLTVEAWVCFTDLVRERTYEIVSNTVNDRGPGWRLILSWASLSLRSGEGGDGQTWGAATKPSAVGFRVGEWYHMAGTYDGAIFRVYVDGALAGQSEGQLALTPGESTVWVGAYRGGYAYGLDALVDDVRLYDYARSPAQVMMDAKLGD